MQIAVARWRAPAFCTLLGGGSWRRRTGKKTNSLRSSGFERGHLRWHDSRDNFGMSLLIILFGLFGSLLCALMVLDDQASDAFESTSSQDFDLP